MQTTLLALQVRTITACLHALDHLGGANPRRRNGREHGQSTAEYALVLLGATTVALVFLAWAGKTSRIGKLFNAVLDTVIGKV